MSLDYLCRWQVEVSVYCFWWIPVHLRCTQCSSMLHLIDNCFLPCICLWHISQIQTCLFVVVGPGFVSTPPAFMRSSASHPAGPHDRLVQKTFVTAVTDPPLTGCVIWSHISPFCPLIRLTLYLVQCIVT